MNKLLYRAGISTLGLGCMLAAAASPASAQSADTGPFAGMTAFGQTLKNDGIYLVFGYSEAVSSVVSGGLQTGTLPTGELDFGTILDLQTILGIPGASVHIIFDERNGIGIGSISGTQGPLQANSGPTRSTRLSEFYWEQAFFNDRIDIKVGRTSPTVDFDTSELSCDYVSSTTCAQPGSWYFSNNNQAYPAATWGGQVNVVPMPNTYIRAGIYDDEPGQVGTDVNGFTWNTTGSTGLFIPVQLGYQTDFTTAALPSHYFVGFYEDASSYTDGSATQLGSYPAPTGIHRQGRSAEWAYAQQTVWRPDPKTNQSLTLYAGGLVYNGGAPYWAQYYGGLKDRAPFGTLRPRDAVNFVASYYANNQNVHPNKATQWIFELNYALSIVPGLTFQPFAQYVLAPNNFGAPPGSKQPDNAWVVGFQASLDLPTLFNWPVWAAY